MASSSHSVAGSWPAPLASRNRLIAGKTGGSARISSPIRASTSAAWAAVMTLTPISGSASQGHGTAPGSVTTVMIFSSFRIVMSDSRSGSRAAGR